METKINLNNYIRNVLLARLFVIQRNNKDIFDLSMSDGSQRCLELTEQNFLYSTLQERDIISKHLYLFLLGSEKSKFSNI